jgi:hypothetical protein
MARPTTDHATSPFSHQQAGADASSTAESPARRPFVVPELRHETDLVGGTADQITTWGSMSS